MISGTALTSHNVSPDNLNTPRLTPNPGCLMSHFSFTIFNLYYKRRLVYWRLCVSFCLYLSTCVFCLPTVHLLDQLPSFHWTWNEIQASGNYPDIILANVLLPHLYLLVILVQIRKICSHKDMDQIGEKWPLFHMQWSPNSDTSQAHFDSTDRYTDAFHRSHKVRCRRRQSTE